jgi:hypothetical protein
MSVDGAWPQATPPIRATHYFGAHWAKNFINAFRREDVSRDFAQLRADGFDTVILVVSWGDFQPVSTPCCRYDERAFQRLGFLINEAETAGLRVMLRIGFAWSFHPQSKPTLERVHGLMNDASERASFLKLVERIAQSIHGRDHVVMSFMSWEDQWLRTIEPSAAQDYARFVAQTPAEARPQDPLRLPRADDDTAIWFHRYWDWLVMDELYRPAQQHIGNMSYEVRSDKEPQWTVGADGQRTVAAWLDHRGMYRQSGTAPLTLYWAPFWGARNQGEQLSAPESLGLLAGMLQEAREWSSQKPSFIGQFNFIDNTPGHENNAVLAPDQIEPFLRGAVCVLKNYGVLGVGLWTGQDYAESPLYNPSFAFGLEGWTLEGAQAASALSEAAERDPILRLSAGQTLSQSFGVERGRLPGPDTRPDQVCVDAQSQHGATLHAQVGLGMPSTLRLAAGYDGRACADIDSRPDGERLRFSLRLSDGAANLKSVWLFDHIQAGGVRDIDGQPGPYLDAIRALNQRMMQSELPTDCA